MTVGFLQSLDPLSVSGALQHRPPNTRDARSPLPENSVLQQSVQNCAYTLPAVLFPRYSFHAHEFILVSATVSSAFLFRISRIPRFSAPSPSMQRASSLAAGNAWWRLHACPPRFQPRLKVIAPKCLHRRSTFAARPAGAHLRALAAGMQRGLSGRGSQAEAAHALDSELSEYERALRMTLKEKQQQKGKDGEDAETLLPRVRLERFLRRHRQPSVSCAPCAPTWHCINSVTDASRRQATFTYTEERDAPNLPPVPVVCSIRAAGRGAEGRGESRFDATQQACHQWLQVFHRLRAYRAHPRHASHCTGKCTQHGAGAGRTMRNCTCVTSA